jgi:hypothetical protein
MITFALCFYNWAFVITFASCFTNGVKPMGDGDSQKGGGS